MNQATARDQRYELGNILWRQAVESFPPQSVINEHRCRCVERRIPVSCVHQNICVQQCRCHGRLSFVDILPTERARRLSTNCSEGIGRFFRGRHGPIVPRLVKERMPLHSQVLLDSIRSAWLPILRHDDKRFVRRSAFANLPRNAVRHVFNFHALIPNLLNYFSTKTRL